MKHDKVVNRLAKTFDVKVKESTLPFYGPIVGTDRTTGRPLQAGPLTIGDCMKMARQVKEDGVFLPKKLSKEWGLTETQVYHALRMVVA